MRTLLLLVMLLPILGFAQENTPVQKPERPPFTLKIAPLNLVNPYQQSVDLHADIPISPRWGIDVGTGFMMHSNVFSRFQGESFLGFKLQPAVKYYTWRLKQRTSYVALIYKYISVNNDHYITAGRQGNQYIEWLIQRKRLITQGVALRLGSQCYVGPRKRVILEPYVGLGWRQLRITEGALPPDAESFGSDGSFFFQSRPGTYRTADLMMGFYLGWRLGSI